MRNTALLTQSPEQRSDFADKLLHDLAVSDALKARTEQLIPLTVAKLEVYQDLGLVDEATVDTALGHPLAVLALIDTVEDVSAEPLSSDPELNNFFSKWHNRTYEKMLALVAGDLSAVQEGEAHRVDLQTDELVVAMVMLAEAGHASRIECADALMCPSSMRILLNRFENEILDETLQMPDPATLTGT